MLAESNVFDWGNLALVGILVINIIGKFQETLQHYHTPHSVCLRCTPFVPLAQY